MSLALRPGGYSRGGDTQGLPVYVPTLRFGGVDIVFSLAKAFAIHALGLCSSTP